MNTCHSHHQEFLYIYQRYNFLDVSEKPNVHGEVKVLVTQLCPTPYDPIDCSLPGSSVDGILQARILEWVVIPFSRVSS